MNRNFWFVLSLDVTSSLYLQVAASTDCNRLKSTMNGKEYRDETSC